MDCATSCLPLVADGNSSWIRMTGVKLIGAKVVLKHWVLKTRQGGSEAIIFSLGAYLLLRGFLFVFIQAFSWLDAFCNTSVVVGMFGAGKILCI